MQRSVTSWWSSSVVWSSSLSPVCSCCRTCRSSSVERPSSSLSTPEAWTNWQSVTLPRSAPPESTSTSSESPHCLSAKHWNVCIECVWLINECHIFHTDHWHGTVRWKNRKTDKERRDKSRRNDLKWSQSQGSLWPQASVFLPTRSDSLSPPTSPPPPRLFYVAVISFPFSNNFMLDCYPNAHIFSMGTNEIRASVRSLKKEKNTGYFTQIDVNGL